MSAKVERLVNLTVALLEAPRPLSFAELRQRTGYYSQQDRESGRRMFERDKDELRRLGVPIQTTPIPHGDDVGYRVVRRAYELPDVGLDAEEVAALALAVRVTGVAGTPLALAKLAARAPDPAPLPEATARVDLAVDPIDAVADAVTERRVLRFSYRTAGGTAGERTIDPYAVALRRGAWYLVGRDHGRDALRAFRLDRMEGAPRALGEPDAFVAPEGLDLAAAVSGPELDGEEVTVAVAPHARWALESRGARPTGEEHDGWPVLVVADVHPERDRAWLLGLGPDVEVLAPPHLRDALRDALDRILQGASS